MSALPLRSWLFIPEDSEKKLGKVEDCGADAGILDLEDSVSPENKAKAREMVAAFFAARPRGQRKSQYWVRVNPFDSGLTLTDLAAVVASAPNGIVQPKTDDPGCVERLSFLSIGVQRLGYFGEMTGHGFRAIAPTLLNESGHWSIEATERALAHGHKEKARAAITGRRTGMSEPRWRNGGAISRQAPKGGNILAFLTSGQRDCPPFPQTYRQTYPHRMHGYA